MKVSELLRVGRGGEVDDMAERLLTEVVREVMRTGRNGSLTLKITVKKNGDRGASFDVKPSRTVPLDELGTILMFADEDGNLTRNDTRQLEFEGVKGVVGGGETRRMIRDEEAAANS